LMDRYTKPFHFNFLDKNGKENPVLMGCYGLGPSRLMGTIVELFNDKNGIIWPKSVAPYQSSSDRIGGDEKRQNRSRRNIQCFTKEKIEVLYDGPPTNREE